MSKIITVDLSEGQIGESEYTFGPGRDYGRGLAMRLLKEHVPDSCGRLDAENAVTGPFYRKHGAQRHQGPYHVKGRGEKGALCFQYHRRFSPEAGVSGYSIHCSNGKI